MRDRNTVDYDVNRKMWCTFNVIGEIFWTDGVIQVRTVLCLAIMLIGKGFDAAVHICRCFWTDG